LNNRRLEAAIGQQILPSLGDFDYDITMRSHRLKHFKIRGRTARAARILQTTLRLPGPLYERVKTHVEKKQTGSINDFIVNALTAYVRAVERKDIDDSFRGMADDKQYQREALLIADEFATSDAESIELSERDLIGA
jgi:hypothetical protein